MFYSIAATLVVIALVLALRDTMSKLSRTESYARNLAKLNKTYANRDSQWIAYVESLEARNRFLEHKSILLQETIYDQTVKLEGTQYTLPMMPKVIKSSNNNNNNGNKDNGNKENKNNNNSQKPTTSAETSKAATLADLGAIAPDEQNLIENWRKNNKPESDMVKWLIARRNQPKAVKA